MNLYLVQHGEAMSEEAVQRSAPGMDREKPLSPRGARDASSLAAACKAFGLDAKEALHSGKLRARQTAQALAEALSLRLRQIPGIDPLSPVKPFAQECAGMSESVIVVGHLPFLERLATFLLSGREEPAAIAFQRGGMVALERRESGDWRVLWTAFPSQPCPAIETRHRNGA